MDFKSMKIWIGNNPALSEKVQLQLFEMGYEWFPYTKVPFHTHGTCLFTWPEGDLAFADYSKNKFDGDTRPEYRLRSETTYFLEERKIVEVCGKRYYEDQLETAIATIIPLD